MYNLKEYSDNYSKTSGRLWQYCRDIPSDAYNAALIDSESFTFKAKIAGKAPAASNKKGAKIAVPLKHLSYFWITLEMSLIKTEINLILTWSSPCVVTNSTCAATLAITDTKCFCSS